LREIHRQHGDLISLFLFFPHFKIRKVDQKGKRKEPMVPVEEEGRWGSGSYGEDKKSLSSARNRTPDVNSVATRCKY
jgi:hypothetical protein